MGPRSAPPAPRTARPQAPFSGRTSVPESGCPAPRKAAGTASAGADARELPTQIIPRHVPATRGTSFTCLHDRLGWPWRSQTWAFLPQQLRGACVCGWTRRGQTWAAHLTNYVLSGERRAGHTEGLPSPRLSPPEPPHSSFTSALGWGTVQLNKAENQYFSRGVKPTEALKSANPASGCMSTSCLARGRVCRWPVSPRHALLPGVGLCHRPPCACRR